MDNQSGSLVRVPTVLSYPEVLKLSEVPELSNQYCYVIKAYPLDGLSVVAARVKTDKGMQINWKFGDWDGNEINVLGTDHSADWVQKFLSDHSSKILSMMQSIHLYHAQFYFSIVNDDLCLVDIRTALNKFTGPGMVQDIFGKIVPTQTIIDKPVLFDEETLEKVATASKPYDCKVIIKPSLFKTIVRNKAMMPMYAIR